MIVRLLFFILVFTIGWVIYRQFMKVISSNSKTPAKKSTKQQGEAMVKCAHCGTFVPTSHAVYNHEQVPFCCVEHQREHHQS